MEQPVARDFRSLTFILKANVDVERVADHASSIAKVVGLSGRRGPPCWPDAPDGARATCPGDVPRPSVPRLTRTPEAARAVVAEDKLITSDPPEAPFEELLEMIRHDGAMTMADGFPIYRVGRELERVADLMCNIAEDIIYLATGQIVRHAKRFGIDAGAPGARPGPVARALFRLLSWILVHEPPRGPDVGFRSICARESLTDGPLDHGSDRGQRLRERPTSCSQSPRLNDEHAFTEADRHWDLAGPAFPVLEWRFALDDAERAYGFDALH